MKHHTRSISAPPVFCPSPSTNSGVEQPAATRSFTFQLCWPSGACIQRYEHVHDLSIERLKQDMDEGLIDGIPRAETTTEGYQLQCYHLLWGTQDLQDGQWLSDYGIPPDAILTVVLETLQSKSSDED